MNSTYSRYISELFIRFKFYFIFLFVVSWRDNIEVVKALLEKGANIEAKDINGYTPLIHGFFSKLFILF